MRWSPRCSPRTASPSSSRTTTRSRSSASWTPSSRSSTRSRRRRRRASRPCDAMTMVDLLLALPWLAPFAAIPRLANTRPNLSDVPAIDGPPVSVIIPARNEARTIETVVRSVLAATYRQLELLVVDDRSTDDTALLVGGLAARDTRVRLIHGEPLPDGWYGKPWACAQGARAAAGAILLFTDADTRHEPELIGRAVGALEAERVDLVTVSPHQRCVTFWE